MNPGLFPYQRIGARWLSGPVAPGASDAALLADDPGLGKSAQAITAADLAGVRSALVICPAIVRRVWQGEFRKFSRTPRDVRVLSTRTDRLGDVAVVSYDFATRYGADLAAARRWDALIADEAHYLKTPSAKRTRAVLGHGQHLGTGGIVASARHRWFLTGTPAPNNAGELYTLARALRVWDQSHVRFVDRYCVVRETTFGPRVVASRRPDELKAMLAPVMLRRLRDDVLKDLPPLRYSTVTLDPEADAATLRDFRAAEASEGARELRRQLDRLAADEIRAITALSQQDAEPMARLRRLTSLVKVRPLAELLAERLAGTTDGVVVFAWHREFLEKLVESLRQRSINAQVLYGGTSEHQRQKTIEDFQKGGRPEVIACQIAAAGTGVTLTRACGLIMAECSFVPAENEQAIRRVHRIGQSRPVLVEYVCIAGSLDEHVMRVFQDKAKNIATFMQ